MSIQHATGRKLLTAGRLSNHRSSSTVHDLAICKYKIVGFTNKIRSASTPQIRLIQMK